MGINPKEIIKRMRGDKLEDPFQQMLFAKIVPNCKKLGLLDASGGWLRDRFTEIGVIQFENWADTEDEYAAFAIGEDMPAAGESA